MNFPPIRRIREAIREAIQVIRELTAAIERHNTLVANVYEDLSAVRDCVDYLRRADERERAHAGRPAVQR